MLHKTLSATFLTKLTHYKKGALVPSGVWEGWIYSALPPQAEAAFGIQSFKPMPPGHKAVTSLLNQELPSKLRTT